MEYISNNQKETQKIAQKIARGLIGGQVLALKGDLGSGKTTFVKGLAKVLGIKEVITSPTFVIHKEYSASRSAVKKLVHIDCYRISGLDDLESIGIYEILQSKDGIIAIEWPEKIKKILSPKTKTITFLNLGGSKRKITTE